MNKRLPMPKLFDKVTIFIKIFWSNDTMIIERVFSHQCMFEFILYIIFCAKHLENVTMSL